MKKFFKVVKVLFVLSIAVFMISGVYSYNTRPLPFEDQNKIQQDPVRDFIDNATAGFEMPDFSNPFTESEPAPETAPAPSVPVTVDLAALRISEPVYNGYDRDLFGNAWKDVDFNGCDTRNDILARDLTNVQSDGNCKILSGILEDDYTGDTIEFVRGKSKVDIDHVIPLSYAYRMGAAEWSADTREAFANDPVNLEASSAKANRSKSDKGPAEWMPSNAGYHCEYGQHFASVAIKYDLPVTQADYNSIVNACG